MISFFWRCLHFVLGRAAFLGLLCLVLPETLQAENRASTENQGHPETEKPSPMPSALPFDSKNPQDPKPSTQNSVSTDKAPLPPVIAKVPLLYSLYYLPFSASFSEGRGLSEVVGTLLNKAGKPVRYLHPADMEKYDKRLEQVISQWQKESLLLKTKVTENKPAAISAHLVSHLIKYDDSAFRLLPLGQRLDAEVPLAGESQSNYEKRRQQVFLETFLRESDKKLVNVFVVSASWCASCYQYRILLEKYAKWFFPPDAVLHSVTVEDPQEKMAKGRAYQELFRERSSRENASVPAFIWYDGRKNPPEISEEGAALQKLYESYLESHRGFLDKG